MTSAAIYFEQTIHVLNCSCCMSASVHLHPSIRTRSRKTELHIKSLMSMIKLKSKMSQAGKIWKNFLYQPKKNIIGKGTELNMPYDWAPNLNEENLPRAWP